MIYILTGVDIVKTDRIRIILNGRKDSFYKRIFTEGEIKYLESKKNDYKTVSGLFAAKEAISKVLGTGIGEISWKDMEIYHDCNGRPKVNLSQKVQPLLERLKINHIEISISHEEEYAIAFAVGFHNLYSSI